MSGACSTFILAFNLNYVDVGKALFKPLLMKPLNPEKHYEKDV